MGMGGADGCAGQTSQVLLQKNERLPGAWIVLLLRAVVVHPAGYVLPWPWLRRNRRRFRDKLANNTA